jgi:hypothetical protein
MTTPFPDEEAKREYIVDDLRARLVAAGEDPGVVASANMLELMRMELNLRP